MDASPIITLTDMEELAAERLDPHWREYFAGGAGSERTLRENIAAFGGYRLRQRVLCGIESVSTAVTVLGHELAMPVLVAPVAYMRRAHEDGEEGMARAAAAVGAGMCLSTFATTSPAAIAATAPGLARFLQVYVYRDRGVTDEVIAMAVDAGFSGVFLTVDLPLSAPAIASAASRGSSPRTIYRWSCLQGNVASATIRPCPSIQRSTGATSSVFVGLSRSPWS